MATIKGIARLGIPSAQTEGELVDQNFDEFGTPRVLLVNPDGTDLLVSSAVPVVGNVAHDAADSGAPIKIGGKVTTGVPGAIANDDRVDAHFDERGNLAVFFSDAAGIESTLRLQDTDGISSARIAQPTQTYGMLFNETSWDRLRNNNEIAVLASAARTATVSSADLTNYNTRGVIITIDVTVDGAAASITPTVEVKDSVGGLYDVIMSMTAVAAVGTFVYVIYPSTLTAAANGITQILQNPLPRTWRVTMTAADADSITYSISASYIL